MATYFGMLVGLSIGRQRLAEFSTSSFSKNPEASFSSEAVFWVFQ